MSKMLIAPLSQELQDKAIKELNEIPNQIENNLLHLRNWLKKQPYSNVARTDDLWLLNFLRGCKFSLKRTKEKLDYFHNLRRSELYLYTNRDPLSADIQELLDSGILLPIVTNNGTCLIILNWKHADPKKIPLKLILKVGIMILEKCIYENSFCMITGFQVIIDYTHFSFGYLPQASFDFLMKTITTLQNAHPYRLKGLHLINLPNYCELLFSLIKPFLQNYFEKLFLYKDQNIDDIFNHVAKEVIPIEYGGYGSSIDAIKNEFKIKMENDRDWFIQDEKRFFDYTRSYSLPAFSKQKSVSPESDTFRKLDID